MKQMYLQKSLAKVIQQKNASLIFSFLMVVANVMLSLTLLLSEEKTVIVPPDNAQTFWVSGHKVSKAYLEEMSIFLINQLLDVSANSAKYQSDLVLRHVAPEYYGTLKNRLLEEAKSYQEKQVATTFNVMDLEINNKTLTTFITGDLTSFVAGRRVTQKRAKYKMVFRYKNRALLLSEFVCLGEQL